MIQYIVLRTHIYYSIQYCLPDKNLFYVRYNSIGTTEKKRFFVLNSRQFFDKINCFVTREQIISNKILKFLLKTINCIV